MNLISLISSQTKCTEQWTQIDLPKDYWTKIGDVSIEDEIDTNSYSIQFTQSSSTSDEMINLGGAVWNSYNLAGKRGLKISFRPSIIVDTAYFGNVKYPQGFAIVITSSSTSNLIGNKGSGIGYDGIKNGIAFEFDFIRQSEKEDYIKPHFSIHFNMDGEISSKSDENCKLYNICNKPLPNFYDNTIEGYKKNMIFEIELIGKKLSVRTNTGNILIDKLEFDPFSQILGKEEIFIGITASMNQNKKVTINDFSLAQISLREKGILKIDKEEYKVGETISLKFQIKSTCGELLKIYPQEYTKSNIDNSNSISLIINNVEEDPSEIVYNFEEATTTLKLDISKIKTGTYTALIKFNDNYSSPVQFTIIYGDVQRLEVCNENENIINETIINSYLEQEKDFFTVPICSYDQYNNSRPIDSAYYMTMINILYPNKYTSNMDLDFNFKEDKIDYKVPFSIFGEYQFFNESFKQNPNRTYNLKVNRISPEKSEATILYEKRLIKITNNEEYKNVILRLKLRDEFGRDIPNKIIKEMNCDFSESKIENIEDSSLNIESRFMENDIIYLEFSSNSLNVGKYTFIPKVTCDGDKKILTLKCSEKEDDENSIYDKCAFHVYKENTGINLNKIRLYSDYFNDYIYYDRESNNNPKLLISLDDADNKKLTEINLLDYSDYPLIDPDKYNLDCFIETEGIKNTDLIINTTNVGYSIAVLLFGENKTRENFNITKENKLVIQITENNTDYIFEIEIKLVSEDKIFNNIYGKFGNEFIFIYQQESYTIESSDNILLYEIYRINPQTNYLVKDKFEISDTLKMTINGDEKGFNFIQKNYSMLVSTNRLKKEGDYMISLYNNNEPIFDNILIKVIPSENVNILVDEQDEEKNEIKMEGDYKYLTLKDKYENIIKDNKAILAFSKMKIKSNGLKAKIIMNGKILIYNDRDSSEEKFIEIILPNGNIYTITKVSSIEQQKLNPNKSYGLLDIKTSITIDTIVSLNLYLYDDNGNTIKNENATKFDIYAIEKFGNNKMFIPLSQSQNNALNYKVSIQKAGEYEIKIFYDNIPITCKACNLIISSNKIPDYSKTRLYIIGNKRKIPVFSEDQEVSQYLYTKKNFAFYLQFYDKFSNEITVNTQYSLTLTDIQKKNYVKLCNYGNSKSEGKQFYHVCSDQLNKFQKEIDNGQYSLEVNGKMFNFTVNKNPITQTNPSNPTKAIYHFYEKEIYGTTDSVVSLIIDLRNDVNFRIFLNQKTLENLKITLKENNEDVNDGDYNLDKMLGPDDGLFTVIVNIKKIGQYSLELIYNNNPIPIKNDIKIIISCGFISQLDNFDKIDSYNYLFFKVFDFNNQQCNKISNNSWNIFNNEDYVQNLIKAQSSDKNIYYSLNKYYNHMTGVLSILIDEKINDDIYLSSDLFKFNYEIKQQNLRKEILNKEYLYAKLNEDNHSVTISILKNNYEPYPDAYLDNINEENLKLNILKYLNDETTLIREINYNKEDKAFNYEIDDIKNPGDYFFVVYLNGEIIPCGECHIKIDHDTNLISTKNTRVYLKNGYNKYIESKKDLTSIIFKTSFPFFKINFYTEDNNLVKVKENDINQKYNILLKYEGDELPIETKVNNDNGNMYVYLSMAGRNKYLDLPDKNIKVELLIKKKEDSGEEISFKYILFNDYSREEKNYEKCNLGPQPVIVDIQPSYILRANEQKEIEIYLDGCTEQVNRYDSIFKLIINNLEEDITKIPADTYGNYLLLIKHAETIINPTTAYIKCEEEKSSNFQISVLPGYDIATLDLSYDDKLEEASTNYKYAYALMDLKDKSGNAINYFGRNLFFNDINELNIQDSKNNPLPYKISFDEDREKFRIEIPISGNGNITIKSKKFSKDLNITVKESKIYRNVNFEMISNKSNEYTFNMVFLDEFYRPFKLPKDFSKDSLSFIYITENYQTQDFFSIQISNIEYLNEEENKITIKLDDYIPKYNSYSFIPIISGFTQICQNCLQKNEFVSYIYSIHNNLYYPHILEGEIYLQSAYEYPLFIYFSSSSLEISDMNKYEINENLYYYILGLKDNNKKDIILNVPFGNITKKLWVLFGENNSESYTKEMNIKLEKYYYNYISFISGNNGKLLDLYFYLDIRNEENFNPVSISNELSTNLLSGNSGNKTLIEYLNVFQTEIDGTYLVIIPNNKLINGKYTINFLNNNKISGKELNFVYFKSLGSFPNMILLSNKEMIYKNMIKYDLIGQNDNSELICDERLNIYIGQKNNSKFLKGDIVNDDNELNMNSCKLYIKFIGDINIITNIGEGFLSELTNNDNSIYNINPHYSKLNINKNIIYSDEKLTEINLNMSFNERSSEDLSFSKDEMPVNKGIKSIRYLTATNYEQRQNINGLFSSEYIFTPSQFKISILGTYLFVGSISRNILEEPIFFSYIKSQETLGEKLRIEYFEDNLWTSVDISQNNRTTNKFTYKYPFKLSAKLFNKYDSLLIADKELKVSVIYLDTDNNEFVDEFDLEVKRINDYEFIIEPNSYYLDNWIHMETRNNKFYIRFIYDELAYYCILDSKNENNLHPRINRKEYKKPGEVLNSNYSLINEYEKETIYYIIPSEPNSEIYCLKDSKDNLFNGNIDPNLLDWNKQEGNINIVNSYRGCIKIGIKGETPESLSLIYDNKYSLGTIILNNLHSSSFDFELITPSKMNVSDDDTDFSYDFKTSDTSIDILNSKFFSIYLNGQKLTKSDYTFLFSGNTGTIFVPQLLSTLVPTKDLKVIYYRGKIEKDIGKVDINIQQTKYQYQNSDYQKNNYKFSAQIPFNLKAGGELYFYLLIKDKNLACYYGKDDNIKKIYGEIDLGFEGKKTFKYDYSEDVPDIPNCQKIYRFKSEDIIEASGLYYINIQDEDKNPITNENFQVQMYISPDKFESSTLTGTNSVYAGETFSLIFSTRDHYNNEPNYYDIIEHFNIKLIHDETNIEIKEDSIKKIIQVVDKKIKITLTVTESGKYLPKLYYKDEELYLKAQILTIKHRDCSFNNPKLDITKIDNRNKTFFSGEEIEINIYCTDIYGNLIENKGKEDFQAIINHTDKYISSEARFDIIHKINFTTESEGNYTIQVMLNGKLYSNPLEIEVIKFNESLYMCMDKRQVEGLEECSYNSEYKILIDEIEGESNICNDSDEFNKGKVFYCKINNISNCIDNTNDCDCDENFDKINGYCYPKDLNPIDLVRKDENKNKITCLNILEGQGITTAKQCLDGSCRLSEDDCNTIFECPLGFKSCGNKCILLNEKCELFKTCQKDEVLCWDYSCAYSYSLCPTRKTCTNEKVLCPDGTCQNSGHCPQPILRKCKNSEEYQCPDFSCVKKKDDCNKNKVCPPGLSLCENDECSEKCENIDGRQYKCSNGLYVDNSQLCPSDMQCPNSWIKCPQGGCAKSLEACKFIQGYNNLVCPRNKPILCPDYECVETFEDCKNNFPICPNHKPYQCWNNECRKSFDECPTKITCPPNKPLLCTNGLCVSSINNCQEKNKEIYELCKESGENQIRCFDGSCVNSIELCPTYSYCGKDKIKCWNGACVDSITNCLSVDSLSQCSGTLTYRCPDGTCRKNRASCSTISVCPNSLPVKCFDNSCRATIDECPEYHSCGTNKVSCPDGTCAKNFDECNTIITCEPSKPYLCSDGSCRAQLEDCPIPPDCGNNKVQCPNGSCETSRQYCKLFGACEAKNPLRCEKNICVDDINRCGSGSERECPMGYVKCSNGDCKIMSSLCEEDICPSNMPYRCPEGVCVPDSIYCDNIENGCPYNEPYKCPDGTCVTSGVLCRSNKAINNNTELCLDGSDKNQQYNEVCPLPNGCPKEKSLKCADGTCVDPESSKCPPFYCPRSKPIKCLNGLCVAKSADCLAIANNEDFVEDGLIMCIDGRKVPSYEFCRPFYECLDGYERCSDNTCRLKSDMCPKYIQCPKERPFRTNEYNICSKYNDTASIYCPINTKKCESTGECINNDEDEEGKCPPIPSIMNQNGCPKENPIRCDNGRCMNSESECILSANACTDDEPFLCKNGRCVSNLENCIDEKCEEGFTRCKNGRCVKDNEESYMRNCTNEIGCPLNKPYRCSNGQCVSSQRKCEIISGENDFSLNIICDSSRPYLCSDYSCESDYSFCKLTVSCPKGQIKCFNGYCVEDETDCIMKYKNYCPQTNPIKCPSGSCTTNILKCPESFRKESCEDGEFYCVRLGKCLTKKSECIQNYKKKTLNNWKFILEEENKVLCFDGTYAESSEKCPIVPSCKVGQYRCENGGCVYNKSLCIVDEEYKCSEGEQKCPDGLCHKNCNEVTYQGCLVGEFLCSNGMCVKSEVSCAGFSMCEDPSVPYRCINGECKSDIALCPEIEKLSSVKNISYSFNKDNKIEFDFAFDPKGRSIGKIIIPSKGINLKDKKYSKINIGEFSTSLVLANNLYNNTPEFLYNVSNGIEGSEGILNYDNSIMSPIFKFFSEEMSNIEFSIPALLVLEHNSYISSSFYYYDYCLAKLSHFDIKNDKLNYNGNSRWECIQRFERDGQNEFRLNDFGVYAIILNPTRDKIDYLEGDDSKDFVFENMKYIIIIIVAILFLGFLIFYVFSRVMRYRGKYHDNLAKIALLKQQKEEYKQMQTDVFGQSLGDNLIGIVYSKNPGFNEEDEEMKDVGGLENEIEEIQRQCRNMEIQNERLKENLDKLETEYKQVNSEIEQIKNNN